MRGFLVILWAGALGGGCGFEPPGVTGGSLDDLFAPGAVCAAAGAIDDDDVVALYTFDDGSLVTVADDTQQFDGTVVGGAARAIPSVAGCGMALEFPTTGTTYVEIPDRPEFHLRRGSIELLVRTSDFSELRGILSRDARNAANPGHLTLYETVEGRIALRMQEDGDMVLCSNQVLEPGTWVQVMINLGDPVELYIDGERAQSDGPVTVPGGDCGEARAMGIHGNRNPWILGGSQEGSDEGAAGPVVKPFRGGAIDHLRIRKTRRVLAE